VIAIHDTNKTLPDYCNGNNISSERTPVAWNYLIYDSEGIGLDVAVDGEAEIDVVIGRRRPARIRIMNAITPMSERV